MHQKHNNKFGILSVSVAPSHLLGLEQGLDLAVVHILDEPRATPTPSPGRGITG